MRLDVSILKYNCGGEKYGLFWMVATVAQAMACQAMVARALTLR